MNQAERARRAGLLTIAVLADGRVTVETLCTVALYLATDNTDALQAILVPNGLPEEPQTVYELYRHVLRGALLSQQDVGAAP